MLIHVAHSPDSDDAFMFYALSENKIDTQGFEFKHVLKDIESLNRDAFEGRHEITAVSIHAYPYIADRYALLGSGASMGENYGPMLVAQEKFGINEIKGRKVAIPGTLTSAYLTLKLVEPDFEHIVVPFNEVMATVKAGKADCGLIIHEGQLQYAQKGFHLVVDLGKWWFEQTNGLPLPLGGNAVRRDLGSEIMHKLAKIQKESIAFGLEDRKNAIDHAKQYARDLDDSLVDQFVSMYVNQRTLDYGEDGKKAVQLLLDQGHQIGMLPKKITVDFID